MTTQISEFPKHPLTHVPPQEPRRPQVQAPTVFVYEKQEWEYKVISGTTEADPLAAERELNALGKDGWELVGIVNVADDLRFYLKRIRK
jgi:hypothetical protein